MPIVQKLNSVDQKNWDFTLSQNQRLTNPEYPSEQAIVTKYVTYSRGRDSLFNKLTKISTQQLPLNDVSRNNDIQNAVQIYNRTYNQATDSKQKMDFQDGDHYICLNTPFDSTTDELDKSYAHVLTIKVTDKPVATDKDSEMDIGPIRPRVSKSGFLNYVVFSNEREIQWNTKFTDATGNHLENPNLDRYQRLPLAPELARMQQAGPGNYYWQPSVSVANRKHKLISDFSPTAFKDLAGKKLTIDEVITTVVNHRLEGGRETEAPFTQRKAKYLESIMKAFTSTTSSPDTVYPLVIKNDSSIARGIASTGVQGSNSVSIDFMEVVGPLAVVCGNVRGNAARKIPEFFGLENYEQVKREAKIMYTSASNSPLFDSEIYVGEPGQERRIRLSSKGGGGASPKVTSLKVALDEVLNNNIPGSRNKWLRSLERFRQSREGRLAFDFLKAYVISQNEDEQNRLAEEYGGERGLIDNINSNNAFSEMAVWLFNHSATIQVDAIYNEEKNGAKTTITSVMATWPNTLHDSVKLVARDMKFKLWVNGNYGVDLADAPESDQRVWQDLDGTGDERDPHSSMVAGNVTDPAYVFYNPTLDNLAKIPLEKLLDFAAYRRNTASPVSISSTTPLEYTCVGSNLSLAQLRNNPKLRNFDSDFFRKVANKRTSMMKYVKQGGELDDPTDAEAYLKLYLTGKTNSPPEFSDVEALSAAIDNTKYNSGLISDPRGENIEESFLREYENYYSADSLNKVPLSTISDVKKNIIVAYRNLKKLYDSDRNQFDSLYLEASNYQANQRIRANNNQQDANQDPAQDQDTTIDAAEALDNYIRTHNGNEEHGLRYAHELILKIINDDPDLDIEACRLDFNNYLREFLPTEGDRINEEEDEQTKRYRSPNRISSERVPILIQLINAALNQYPAQNFMELLDSMGAPTSTKNTYIRALNKRGDPSPNSNQNMKYNTRWGEFEKFLDTYSINNKEELVNYAMGLISHGQDADYQFRQEWASLVSDNAWVKSAVNTTDFLTLPFTKSAVEKEMTVKARILYATIRLKLSLIRQQAEISTKYQNILTKLMGEIGVSDQQLNQFTKVVTSYTNSIPKLSQEQSLISGILGYPDNGRPHTIEAALNLIWNRYSRNYTSIEGFQTKFINLHKQSIDKIYTTIPQIKSQVDSILRFSSSPQLTKSSTVNQYNLAGVIALLIGIQNAWLNIYSSEGDLDKAQENINLIQNILSKQLFSPPSVSLYSKNLLSSLTRSLEYRKSQLSKSQSSNNGSSTIDINVAAQIYKDKRFTASSKLGQYLTKGDNFSKSLFEKLYTDKWIQAAIRVDIDTLIHNEKIPLDTVSTVFSTIAKNKATWAWKDIIQPLMRNARAYKPSNTTTQESINSRSAILSGLKDKYPTTVKDILMKSADFMQRAPKSITPIAKSTVVESVEEYTGDPFKAPPKRQPPKLTQGRTTIAQTLLQLESRYSSVRDHRAKENMEEEAEANRILRSMTAGDEVDDTPPHHTKTVKPIKPSKPVKATKTTPNPYDAVDYKSPFKKERDLQPKADAKPDAKPEVKIDDKKDTKKKIKKPHLLSAEPFKQVAGKMGEDLYAVSDYEYNYTQMKSSVKADPEPLPSPRSDDEPVLLNRILRRVISNLGTETNRTAEFRDFLSQDRENFWHGGSIHAVILNDKTGQLFFFVADPGADFSTLVSGGFVSVAKRTPHGMTERNLTREQERILDRAKSIGDDYVKYARRTIETGYKHGYSEAVELRRQLLNALGLGEGYVPPLDRDPQDIEAEREHKRKKAQNEPGHTAKTTSTT